ncbi:MAG: hypothetical protein M3680_13625 [Myxococcota bacterium]|nr:hypothetical protein [Myxococcota bacterium]
MTSNGTTPAPDHAAQFYASDAFLAQRVIEYVAGGLAAGEPVVVIALGAEIARRLVVEGELRASTAALRRAEALAQQHAPRVAQLEARDQLRQTELKLKLLVGSVRDYASFMLDPTGRIETWNPGAQLAKGYAAAEIIGERIDVFYLPEAFLSIVSHELKTPLAGLQLQLAGLLGRADRPDPRLADKLQRAHASGERLSDLIETLLDVSRIATGRLVLAIEDFELASVVRETLETFQPSAAKAGCTLELTCAEPVRGAFDRVRLAQVISNLMSNASSTAPVTPSSSGSRRSPIAPSSPSGTTAPASTRPRRADPREPRGVARGQRLRRERGGPRSRGARGPRCRRPPRVIILELMMPVMDGRELRRCQLADPRLSRIPVVVISASRDVVEVARELGTAGHLKKPLHLEELLALLARHCDHPAHVADAPT